MRLQAFNQFLTAILLASLLASLAATANPPPIASVPTQPLRLSEAPEGEQKTLAIMLKDSAWPRRAIAALRLERYGCDQSLQYLEGLLRDSAWQVRAFTVRSLARRQVQAGENWFADEADPRVLRAALRYRYEYDTQRLMRGIETLAKSNDLKSKMLAAELGAASGDLQLRKSALDAVRQIILRMNRAECGSLTPRLAALTGQHNLTRPYQWQQWFTKNGRRFELQPAFLISHNETSVEPAFLAQLDSDQFVGLQDYMAKLSENQVDLSICLDCTASMSREIAAAQGGIDDMMLFASDIVASLRVALVAYRDRSDEFETKAWEFTSDIAQLRHQLWQLAADGGGDGPEAVYPAMHVALNQMKWRPESKKTLVIVGDAPPHPGYGAHCINLAKRGKEEAQLITHTIQAKGKDVKHFPEIAAAGEGRCVSLKEVDTLMAEITGLTLGDRYTDELREFFRIYLELCR